MYDNEALETAVADIGACRYDGIEVNLGELRRIGTDALNDLLTDNSLDAYCVMGVWLESDEQVNQVASAAELAADIDADFVALLPPRRGYTNDKTVARWLETICDAAADAGVTPVLHHHGATHVEQSDEIERWLEDGPDNLGLLFDTAHYFPYGGGSNPVLSGIEQFADHIAYVHYKDVAPPSDFEEYVAGLSAAEYNLDNVINYFRSFTDLGEGIIDFASVREMLDEIGYDGPTTIEIENQTADPLLHAKRNRDYYLSETV